MSKPFGIDMLTSADAWLLRIQVHKDVMRSSHAVLRKIHSWVIDELIMSVKGIPAFSMHFVKSAVSDSAGKQYADRRQKRCCITHSTDPSA
jgi:hypothetical protein